jgi:hypothetical protein
LTFMFQTVQDECMRTQNHYLENFRAKYSLATTWPPDIRQIIRYI